MTKSELIARLSRKFTAMTQREVERVVETILTEISSALRHGHRVELRGFGAFSIRKREARTARNPKNGEVVHIRERYAIYFRACKELKQRINTEFPE